MKLTQEIIDQIQEAMLHTNLKGEINWKDGDEIEVQIAGTFESIEKLRNFLCDRKYDTNCDKDIGSTFDYIKHIKWFFEIEE